MSADDVSTRGRSVLGFARRIRRQSPLAAQRRLQRHVGWLLRRHSGAPVRRPLQRSSFSLVRPERFAALRERAPDRQALVLARPRVIAMAGSPEPIPREAPLLEYAPGAPAAASAGERATAGPSLAQVRRALQRAPAEEPTERASLTERAAHPSQPVDAAPLRRAATVVDEPAEATAPASQTTPRDRRMPAVRREGALGEPPAPAPSAPAAQTAGLAPTSETGAVRSTGDSTAAPTPRPAVDERGGPRVPPAEVTRPVEPPSEITRPVESPSEITRSVEAPSEITRPVEAPSEPAQDQSPHIREQTQPALSEPGAGVEPIRRLATAQADAAPARLPPSPQRPAPSAVDTGQVGQTEAPVRANEQVAREQSGPGTRPTGGGHTADQASPLAPERAHPAEVRRTALPSATEPRQAAPVSETRAVQDELGEPAAQPTFDNAAASRGSTAPTDADRLADAPVGSLSSEDAAAATLPTGPRTLPMPEPEPGLWSSTTPVERAAPPTQPSPAPVAGERPAPQTAVRPSQDLIRRTPDRVEPPVELEMDIDIEPKAPPAVSEEAFAPSEPVSQREPLQGALPTRPRRGVGEPAPIRRQEGSEPPRPPAETGQPNAPPYESGDYAQPAPPSGPSAEPRIRGIPLQQALFGAREPGLIRRYVEESPARVERRDAAPSESTAEGASMPSIPALDVTLVRREADVTQASAEPPREQGAGAQQPDIEQLAEEVYRRLRERLRVERERLGGGAPHWR